MELVFPPAGCIKLVDKPHTPNELLLVAASLFAPPRACFNFLSFFLQGPLYLELLVQFGYIFYITYYIYYNGILVPARTSFGLCRRRRGGKTYNVST